MFLFNRLRPFWPTWQPTPTADRRSSATVACPSSFNSFEVRCRPLRRSQRPNGGQKTLLRWQQLKGSFRNQQLRFQGKQLIQLKGLFYVKYLSMFSHVIHKLKYFWIYLFTNNNMILIQVNKYLLSLILHKMKCRTHCLIEKLRAVSA